MGDMRNLALLFFLFVLTAALAPVSCSDKPEKLTAHDSFEEPETTHPAPPLEVTQELQDVRYSQNKGNKLQWQLVARTVAQTADGPINLESVEITYYGDDDRVTVITADTGLYDGDGRNAMLRGNVTVTISDGGRVETAEVLWDQEAQTLSGDGEVAITRGGSTIRGKGFELLTETETVRIYRVDGVIQRGEMGL